MTEIKLSPDHTGIILTLESGKEFHIGSRDGWPMLIGMLERLAGGTTLTERQEAARARVQAIAPFPPGAPVRFCPPSPSVWRELAPMKNQDSIMCKVAAATKDPAQIMVIFSDGMSCIVPAKYLTIKGREITSRGTYIPSLEELGLV